MRNFCADAGASGLICASQGELLEQRLLEPGSLTEQVKRATALWHACRKHAGERFEISRFVADKSYEAAVIQHVRALDNPPLREFLAAWEAAPGPGPEAHQQTSWIGTGRNAPPATPAAQKPVRQEDSSPSGIMKTYLRGVR